MGAHQTSLGGTRPREPNPAIWTRKDIVTGSPADHRGRHEYQVTRLSHPDLVNNFRKVERAFRAALVMARTRRIGAGGEPRGGRGSRGVGGVIAFVGVKERGGCYGCYEGLKGPRVRSISRGGAGWVSSKREGKGETSPRNTRDERTCK